jgi:hypothetical protein
MGFYEGCGDAFVVLVGDVLRQPRSTQLEPDQIRSEQPIPIPILILQTDNSLQCQPTLEVIMTSVRIKYKIYLPAWELRNTLRVIGRDCTFVR